MRQVFYVETEVLFERACQLREFGDKGEITWREWYNWNTERTGHTSGELEISVAESMGISHPARSGFAVTMIDHECVVVQDLEEIGSCDLNDPEDGHMVLPITQFREWLYNWAKEPVNRVMDTTEAAALWNYSSADAVKRLCREGKVKCRKLTNGTWILDRNQPSPKMK